MITAGESFTLLQRLIHWLMAVMALSSVSGESAAMISALPGRGKGEAER